MNKMLLAGFATLLPALAHAGTFVVDAQLGSGADFQGVQEALDSPLVVDDDTLLIRPGSYLRINTSKSVTMMGLGVKPSDTNFFKGFATHSTFKNCASQFRLSNLEFAGISITNCSDLVYLDGIELDSLTLSNAPQVRVENEVLSATTSFSARVASGSHVEFLRCNLVGESGSSGANGETAVDVFIGSFARFADCTVRGGNGGNYPQFGFYGGIGGAGIWVTGSSQVQFIGQTGNTIKGGHGGWGVDAQSDGAGRSAVIADFSSSVRLSNALLVGGFDATGSIQAADYSGPPTSLTTAIVPDPFLAPIGSFAPGSTATFLLSGEPNAPFIAFIGSQVTAIPLAGIIGILATDFASPFLAGQLNVSGAGKLTIAIPLGVPIGTLRTVQLGTLYAADNSIRLSNPNTVWIQ